MMKRARQRFGRSLAAAIVLAGAAPAMAQFTALVVSEPTERKDTLVVSRAALETSLGRITGQPVKASTSDDLTDAMRATRSAGYDVIVAPPQVVASALAHGYELIGSTEAVEQYVLIGRSAVANAAALRGGRIYLPQQDSIYTYLARGMLNADGLSFRDLRQVQYARFPQAGLHALVLNQADATVTRREDWDAFAAANPGVAKVLATSGAVPGGLSVAIKKNLLPDLRGRLVAWFLASAPTVGLKPVAQRSELRAYQRVSELGTFTPTSLPGAKVVDAPTVKRLMAQGAVLVDTRNEQEFKQRHISGARWIPYIEKSLKDTVYDAKADSFVGLEKLDKNVPVIFQCNGAECWKSYKASRSAIAAGFTQVNWFRGGLPEWEAARLD
jgi:rhodanese-related sulfurtransferase/ABC-type phosphate/phosphonate transport system substrate-binding protein